MAIPVAGLELCVKSLVGFEGNCLIIKNVIELEATGHKERAEVLQKKLVS